MKSFFFNLIPNLLLCNENYCRNVSLKNSTQKKYIKRKCHFEAQNFCNGDNKHEDQTLLLFSEEAEWSTFGVKTKIILLWNY